MIDHFAQLFLTQGFINDDRLNKKLVTIHTEIAELSQELATFTQKLHQIPDKILILELLQGKPLAKVDLEKKKLYDLLQMIAYHSRKHLISIFGSCYEDKRDIEQVLTMITKLPGYVKLVGKTLIVLLDRIENKKHRQAAIEFCHRINKLQPTLLGRMEFKLYFRISSRPTAADDSKTKCTNSVEKKVPLS